ncbi:hypothetical protein KSZ68_20590, partial [Bacteroides thetaiotaomicron]|nr:hypothetical protein [Bacteroides thetaiotaomicron]MBV4254087.1 hypothetical protein [Bacteroides thetaiotaomicron]MBV4273011.1 hypothetical protein [Bacteroides thetaiotaomicron]MDC2108247.1 hypothetical protein [Bacteroides thetaiotaomicron]
TKPGLVKVWALCIKKGCASVLTQPHSSANAVAQLCQRHGTNIKNKRGNTVRGESPFSYNKTIN